MRPYHWFALVVFLLQYAGYHYILFVVAEKRKWITRESIIREYRRKWVEVIARDRNHLLAIQSIRNLEMLNTFLISLTMLMMGGIISVFGANLDWVKDFEHGEHMLFLMNHKVAVKLLVALGLLTVAFFNFIFSVRINYNMNFTISMAGEGPMNLGFLVEQVQRSSRHFIIGIRALYHIIIPMVWIIDTTLMLATTVVAVVLLARFDFLLGDRARETAKPKP